MSAGELIAKGRELPVRTVTFLQEVWAELKKVHWPSRKETYAATVVVVVIVALVAVYLGTVDFLLSQVVQAIVR
jgi:preprotein translocase subunit SecE